MKYIIILILLSMNIHAYQFTKDLSLGSRGKDVVELQKFLIKKNLLVIPKNTKLGYFGNLTKASLLKYQKSNNISPANGLLGPKTRKHINTKLQNKRRGGRPFGRPMMAQVMPLPDPKGIVEGIMNMRQVMIDGDELIMNPKAITFSKDLTYLQSDRDVRYLKMFLFCKNLIQRSNTDTFFDLDTQKALKKYQSRQLIPETGILDKKTREHINKNHPLNLLWYIHMIDTAHTPTKGGSIFTYKQTPYLHQLKTFL